MSIRLFHLGTQKDSMYEIHITQPFKDWLLHLPNNQMQAAGWALGMLRSEGCLQPDEAQKRGVLYSGITTNGNPLVRVEIYGAGGAGSPAVFAYMHEGDRIHILMHGNLSDLSLAAIIKAGSVLSSKLKGQNDAT